MTNPAIRTLTPGGNAKQLRLRYYNAEVSELIKIHDELMILRVKPDTGQLTFEPGQYAVLGMGYWEPRIAGSQSEKLAAEKKHKLVKRAYSISNPLINVRGKLNVDNDASVVEFYIALIRQAAEPPALTPRLFELKVGDRLYLSPKAFGHYTLERIKPDHQVIFAATGTGEAPHNAMIAKLLASGHQRPIACLTCVRNRKDLGYLEQHRLLEQHFENYRYVPITTREPENLDKSCPSYVGKRYLQDVFAAEDFSDRTGCQLQPVHTHIFLCGGPEMIGVPRYSHDPAIRYPKPLGMVEVLERKGFRVDQPHRMGNIHIEKYW